MRAVSEPSLTRRGAGWTAFVWLNPVQPARRSKPDALKPNLNLVKPAAPEAKA
jgi:hypothetical protein